MNKRIGRKGYKTRNTYKKAEVSDASIKKTYLKLVITVVFTTIVSLAFIFIYDFITQTDFFNIKEIEISGTERLTEDEIINFTELRDRKNIFEVNLFSVEKEIVSHPWVQSASVKRKSLSELVILIWEEKPIAIVQIGDLAEVLINNTGKPFKEHNSEEDNIENLPIISGLELTRPGKDYVFSGSLFDSIMKILKNRNVDGVKQIIADENTGVSIETLDIYNKKRSITPIKIKLGFDDFEAKLDKAKKLSDYINKNFPEKIICSMDFFNIEKVFVKTKKRSAQLFTKGGQFAGK